MTASRTDHRGPPEVRVPSTWPEDWGRRRFLKWLGGGLLLGGMAALGLRGCGRPAAEGPTTPLVVPPTQKTWTWKIRWIDGVPQVEKAAWRLRLEGMVTRPVEVDLATLRAMPALTLRLRIKCVECWSAPALWTGVPGQDLLALVEPLAGAEYVMFHALDDYTSTLSLEELRGERVLFVYEMDGQPLPLRHGFPLRLLIPSHYGYKNVKAIVRLEFSDTRVRGYWERRGHDNVGMIQPGLDHPLDLGETRQIGGGEITEY